MELTSNGTKGRMGQNIKWKKRRMEKTPKGTKCRMKKRRMGQNVEWKNIEWDKMSNGNIFGFLFVTLLCVVNQAILAWSA
jgi:hypothetical protein